MAADQIERGHDARVRTPPGDWAWRSARTPRRVRLHSVFALGVSGILFALFLGALGKSPVEFFALIWRGGFGTFFSWQSTLQRAAPLILTAFCVAIPARIGLIIIGGEGALVLGGFAAAISAIPLLGVAPPWAVVSVMAVPRLSRARRGSAWQACCATPGG